MSSETTVAEGEFASIIYQSTPRLRGGWALRERKACVGEERQEGDGFVFIHQRERVVFIIDAFLRCTCVCVKAHQVFKSEAARELWLHAEHFNTDVEISEKLMIICCKCFFDRVYVKCTLLPPC